MKKSIYLSIALMFVITISKAQTTAMQMKGVDCKGVSHDLFADLDAGKAVLLHFFMPNCGSCPPPAQKIQKMANGILSNYPGMITAYAMPFNNSTTCSYASTWVSSNSLSLYTPMDSGAAQVAYYGGFGMPTVVLLGGKDHKVLYSSQSFSTSDTTVMKKAILDLLKGTTGIDRITQNIGSLKVYPNPATDKMQVELMITKSSNVKIEVVNLNGEIVNNFYEGNTNEGIFTKEINTSTLNSGVYFIRVISDNNIQNHKFTVIH